MKTRFPRLAPHAGIPLTLLIVSMGALGLQAQGTRADYKRFLDLRNLTQNKVFRSSVKPHWFAGNDRFWYRIQSSENAYEFIVVDAGEGKRRRAFDHEQVAEAFSDALQREVTALELPVQALDFEENQPRLTLTGPEGRWIWDPQAKELTQAAPKEVSADSLGLLKEPLPSRNNGPDTHLTFRNETKALLELFWIDREGERQSYGRLRPGQQRRQHTFAGHVWLIQDAKARRRIILEAPDQELAVNIDESLFDQPGQPRRRQNARPGRRRPDRSRSENSGRSPDGNWRVEIRDHNVYLRALPEADDHPRIQLTKDGHPENFYKKPVHWSPDGNRFVVFQEEPAEEHTVYMVESSPSDQVQPKLKSLDYLKPGDRIAQSKPHLFDAAAQKEIPVRDDLFANPWRINRLRWRADSRAFTFLYNQRGHQVLRLLEVNATNGHTRALVNEQSPTFVDYNGKFYLNQLEKSPEIIWMSERDGWNHLYLIDRQTGQVKNQITRGPWAVREVVRVDEENRQVWFRAGGIHPDQDPYHIHLARVDFDGTKPVTLTGGNGTHDIEFSPDRRFLVDQWSRVDQPPVTELRRARDGELLCVLEEADWSSLRETGWQVPEPFQAKGRDGETDIFGVLYRPTQFDPARRYPVIEKIYAGPHSAHVPKSFRSFRSAQALAELGFIVVQIDGMGTSHRSKEFHDVCWKNLKDAGFPDRIAWLRAAARKYPWLDLDRVGIFGGSAGGQNALAALLWHPDFYKVAVSDCGCHDNRMDKIWWNELWMGWPVGPEYADNSNVTHAHRLEGRLLLTVGELDRNVDPASTMQVVDALIKADRDFDLIIVPGAGHGVGDGSAYMRRRRADFFVRHLLGVEPRAP